MKEAGTAARYWFRIAVPASFHLPHLPLPPPPSLPPRPLPQMTQVVSVDESSGQCDIKYLDYGGYHTLPLEDLKQIRTDFLSLPFQVNSQSSQVLCNSFSCLLTDTVAGHRVLPCQHHAQGRRERVRLRAGGADRPPDRAGQDDWEQRGGGAHDPPL